MLESSVVDSSAKENYTVEKDKQLRELRQVET
jgi:hypothetical protein